MAVSAWDFSETFAGPIATVIASIGLRVGRIELDEIWSYVGKKQKRVKRHEIAVMGDQYVFIAMASSAKAILTYRIGKRDGSTCQAFVYDLAERILGNPEISTDGFHPYWSLSTLTGPFHFSSHVSMEPSSGLVVL